MIKRKKALRIRYKGQENDTWEANAYALKCMYVSFGVLFAAWILDLLGIFIVDLKIMNIATGGAAVICASAFLYAFLVGIDTSGSRYVIMLALVGMATVICMMISYHTTMFMLFPLICSAQYFDRRITIYTCIITCAGIALSVMVGYRIGLCDANMLLLTYTDSAYHSQALISGDFVVNTDKSLIFLFFVFPRWMIVFALMPLMNHVAKDIQIRTAREAMARHMAEVDGLTGLYNRTKYLQSIVNYYPACNSVAVLFFDVNNLKLLNDTRGHEYGDILICGLADVLKERNSETFKTFRLGGDEFVSVLEGEDAQHADEILAELDSSLQGRKLESDVRLSVAIGMAKGSGQNIEKLVKEADENMYAVKQSMKSISR